MQSTMLTRRNCLLRFSIILNVVVLLYVATNIASKNGAGVVFIEEMQASGRNLASIDNNEVGSSSQQETVKFEVISGPGMTNVPTKQNPPSLGIAYNVNQVIEEFVPKPLDNFQSSSRQNVELVPQESSPEVALSTSTVSKSTSGKDGVVEAALTATPEDVSVETELLSAGITPGASQQLQDIVKCYERDRKPRVAQRSEFWVLYNYVPARRTFRCYESITYTTHADYTFLDNLKPLLERWQGPVSLAMHAPGTDFAPTIEAIRYARDCLSPLVSELVTFHIFFGMRYHVPKAIPPADKVMVERANCSRPAPWENVTSSMLYKSKKKILYPVNVGRNVARESAVTHFILPSDIELYPSPGVIRDFLDMIIRQEGPFLHKNPKVYPLSIFEIEKGASLPRNKSELVSMLKTSKAIPFHKTLCPGCHNVPKSKEWLAANQTEGLHVFHIGKRTGYYIHWEPIFIGTHDDPLYDERLSWEGKSDKMTQGYSLCVLDYEFQILDNAFLVHKPGIKKYKPDSTRDILASKTNALIRKVIYPELKVLFGTRKGCGV